MPSAARAGTGAPCRPGALVLARGGVDLRRTIRATGRRHSPPSPWPPPLFWLRRGGFLGCLDAFALMLFETIVRLPRHEVSFRKIWCLPSGRELDISRRAPKGSARPALARPTCPGESASAGAVRIPLRTAREVFRPSAAPTGGERYAGPSASALRPRWPRSSTRRTPGCARRRVRRYPSCPPARARGSAAGAVGARGLLELGIDHAAVRLQQEVLHAAGDATRFCVCSRVPAIGGPIEAGPAEHGGAGDEAPTMSRRERMCSSPTKTLDCLATCFTLALQGLTSDFSLLKVTRARREKLFVQPGARRPFRRSTGPARGIRVVAEREY